MNEWIDNNIGVDNVDMNIWWRLALISGIIIAAYLVDIILSRLIVPGIRKIVSKTSTQTDDILLSEKATKSFCSLLPPVLMAFALPFALKGTAQVVVERFMLIYIVVNVCRFLSTLVDAFYELFVYRGHEKARSLKGLSQTFQVLIWFLGAIAMASILIDKSPMLLLGGLGAFATVMMLVFQDSIKGLVAGVQLSVNDMLRPGDWIAMPGRNIDGVVIEVTLTTVKIQNWDNTIMTIPPYALVTETFQNWKGMTQSQGRRINRSVNINAYSVRFCSPVEFSEWKQKGYLPESAQEESATNLQAFRGFMEMYLKKNPDINNKMTLMVRQLSASDEGIPLQLYCFSRTKVWEEYEKVQATIVEYMLATMSDFGIYVFQRGSTADKLLLESD